jgi:hypothetical protein
VPRDGDIVRVAAEAGNVLSHPPEGGDDVLDGEVRGVFECSAVVGEGEPPEGAESVVQRDTDGTAGRGEPGCVRSGLGVRSHLESAAIDIDDDGQRFVGGVFGCPHVEVEAVFAESVVGLEPRGGACLEGCGSLLVVWHVRVEGQQDRAVETFCGGEGDTEPGADGV